MSIAERLKGKSRLADWLYELAIRRNTAREDKQKQEMFMQEFEQARLELETARQNYNYAKEPALLEYYIYEIKAAETRLNYYLKLAKKEKLMNRGYMQGLFAGQGERREELS